MLLCLTAGYAQKECDGGNHNPPPIPPHPQDSLDGAFTSGAISADPNEIIGPTGYDDSIRWVSINDVLNYTIFFENDPDFATANAQKVDVRFNFADKAAMKGFGLGTYGFANQSWNIEDAPSAYQNRLDLRDSMNIYVDLTAGIDVVQQQAFWLFNSIDPETGYNPWQVDRGMLPVNDSTHVGEGFVTFRLKPQEDLKTGDTISIVASIVFDQNDTIPTNRWRNTIDAGMPTSKVKCRQDSKNENLYHITLQAADDEGGSGLKRVLLYQANNFGIYEEVATCPVDTVIEFTAEPGHQYRFYSIAEDNTGNREPLKEQPDLIININAAPTDIVLSDSTFQDDIKPGGFIAELASVDVEEGGSFKYSLAEGDGAIHNDLFQITGTQLQAKQLFRCAEDTIYSIRICTTDEGGLSFSKAFDLTLNRVLVKPNEDTINVSICEGEYYNFHGKLCNSAGTYYFTKDNELMCDSVFVLNLTVLPIPEKPIVSIEGISTLVSSAQNGNQWFFENGTPIENATGQKFTPQVDGIYYVAVTNGSCYSEPSDLYQVILSDNIDLKLELDKGWNWVSSNLSDSMYLSAEGFLTPIINVVSRMEGVNSELNNSDNVIVGGLTDIKPQESYKLLLDNSVTGQWVGVGYNPDEYPIILNKGWNWIGYISVGERKLADAFSNLSPSENDVVKTLDKFSVFHRGEWTGTLETMQPGIGYMYYTTAEKQMTYPVTRVFKVKKSSHSESQSISAQTPSYQFDKNAYRDNMTVIAELYAGGEKTIDGVYSVGAFVNNECRGTGLYINGLLYITIHGTLDNNEVVSFRASENITGNEYVVDEKLTFDGSHVGTITAPYKLHALAVTGIYDVSIASYNIYPNPVRSIMYISGNLDDIQGVKVLTTNGETVVEEIGYKGTGINVTTLSSGFYVVAIKTSKGYIYKKILKAGN